MRFNIFNRRMGVAICSLMLCCLIISPSCGSVQKTLINIQNKHQLDTILNQYVDEGYFPFLFARLEDKNGRVLYEHCRINRNLIPKEVIDKQTWIRIWSMSKIITITIIMDLVEDGHLHLDEPVTKYIPEFDSLQVAVNENGVPLGQIQNKNIGCKYILVKPDSIMTLRHLINHQAGFYYATTGIDCIDSILVSKNLLQASDSDDLINRLATVPLLLHPGSKYYYGTNTTVLGMVAERATGLSLKNLVEIRLFSRLNIKGLKYNLSKGETLLPYFTGIDSILRIARKGELDIFGPDLPFYRPDNQLYLGGEGMVATADGYADFLRIFLHNGKLNDKRFLDENTIDKIVSPHTQINSPWGYNGYNLWITGDTLRKRGWGEEGLWQGGGYEGTQFWIDSKREFVGVIMTQIHHTPNGGWDMYNDFRGALYQQFWKDER
ncbi:MAG TPA: class C beta-lactamase-related serine hydrolase [Candidatus Marinimicrobia bacterium]|nr:class C beta-lactamase-related serine hydrolase [Candidatus Neomarinimicrobiota bacterium]